MKNSEEEQIKKLLELDEDELYHKLALFLPDSADSMYSRSTLIKVGKKAFEDLRGKLYLKICVESELRAKLDEPQFNDQVTLAATLTDIIASAAIGFPIPPVNLSVLLVRIGVRKFCLNGI